MEKWKSLQETGFKYSISNFGRIKRHGKNKDYILNGYADGLGYRRFTACVEKRQKKYLVHRLVALYFIENPHNKPYVNHKDGDRMNAHYLNLEWITLRDNLIHGIKRKHPNKLIGANYNSFYGKWVSKIAKDKVIYDLGLFDTDIEAHEAYVKKAKELGLSLDYI